MSELIHVDDVDQHQDPRWRHGALWAAEMLALALALALGVGAAAAGPVLVLALGGPVWLALVATGPASGALARCALRIPAGVRKLREWHATAHRRITGPVDTWLPERDRS